MREFASKGIRWRAIEEGFDFQKLLADYHMEVFTCGLKGYIQIISFGTVDQMIKFICATLAEYFRLD